MRLAGAIIFALAVFAVFESRAVPFAIVCVTESGEPCPVDERPSVSGAEAEANWRQAYPNRALPEGARVLDHRNGRFDVITAPLFTEVPPGFCSVHVEQIGIYGGARWVHARMSHEDCSREADVFARGDMRWPLSVPGAIECESGEPYWCFYTLAIARQAVAQVGQNANARVAGLARERDAQLSAARGLMARERPYVRSRLSGGRWECARVSSSHMEFDGVSVMACQDATETGEYTTIYVDGPYYH